MSTKKASSKVPSLIENPWHLYLAVAAFVRRILLHGETPGTGKTTAAFALADSQGAELVSITLHEDTLPSDIIGHFVQGENGTRWHDGPAGYAIRRALAGTKVALVINEIDKGSTAVTQFLYPLLDCGKASNFRLPNGETLSIPDTLTIIGTMNPSPEIAFAETGGKDSPIVSRFQVIIDVGAHVSPMVLDALPEQFRSMVADGRLAAREVFAMLEMVARGCEPFVAVQATLGAQRASDYGDALALALS